MTNPPDLPSPSKGIRSRTGFVLALILGLFLGVTAVGSIGWLMLCLAVGFMFYADSGMYDVIGYRLGRRIRSSSRRWR